MTGCTLLFGVAVVLFAASPRLAPALLALAAGDLVVMFGMALNTTMVQEVVPDDMRGRVMSLTMMSFGLTPLAVLPASAAARAFGVQATVAAGGVLLVLFSLALYALSRPFRALDDPAPRPRLAALLTADAVSVDD